MRQPKASTAWFMVSRSLPMSPTSCTGRAPATCRSVTPRDLGRSMPMVRSSPKRPRSSLCFPNDWP